MGKTSSETKARWNREHYKKLSVDINKEDGEMFKEKCKEDNVSQSEVLKRAVYEYIGKPVPPSKAKF